jgi:hypothetical protein
VNGTGIVLEELEVEIVKVLQVVEQKESKE